MEHYYEFWFTLAFSIFAVDNTPNFFSWTEWLLTTISPYLLLTLLPFGNGLKPSQLDKYEVLIQQRRQQGQNPFRLTKECVVTTKKMINESCVLKVLTSRLSIIFSRGWTDGGLLAGTLPSNHFDDDFSKLQDNCSKHGWFRLQPILQATKNNISLSNITTNNNCSQSLLVYFVEEDSLLAIITFEFCSKLCQM